MRQATLCFLVKERDGKIAEILLGKKQLRLGVGKWNGAGGHVEDNETIAAAMVRETREELRVTPTGYRKVGELCFEWPTKPEHEQLVHAFFCSQWDGEPVPSDELAELTWFPVSALPANDMWEADRYWLPDAFQNPVAAFFRYDANGKLSSHPRVYECSGTCPRCGGFLKDDRDGVTNSGDGGGYLWYPAVACTRPDCEYFQRTSDQRCGPSW